MVLCFRHGDYRGMTPPDISCKACCHIFISLIKKLKEENKPLPDFLDTPVKLSTDRFHTKPRRFNQPIA